MGGRPAAAPNPVRPSLAAAGVTAGKWPARFGGPGRGEQAMTSPLKGGLAALAAVLVLAGGTPAGAASRINDLANVEGVRQHQLIGYGLVVGLAGTGDTLTNTP